MNILILNWRDVKNPKSGGAEILTHEIAKYFVKNGHSVVQFSSYFAGCRKEDVIDGVRIIREGNPDLRTAFFSVHFKAFKWYIKNKNSVDYVIDEIHGVPFFTPFYVNKKKLALICEYAGSLWDKAVAFPFNYFGKLVEKTYPIFYRSIDVVTISESSRKEIQNELFTGKKIYVIHPGCTAPVIDHLRKKPEELNLLFIARLSKTKGIEDAIEVMRQLKDKNINAALHIVGRGEEEYVKKIKKRINKYELSRRITLYGYVTEEEKIKIIDKSHILIIPSQKEGWGLTVHEVNSRGVPVVAYNISGIRDVVKNGVNGFLVKENIPNSLVNEILTLVRNKKKYNLLAELSIGERKKFTWEHTYKELSKILQI